MSNTGSKEDRLQQMREAKLEKNKKLIASRMKVKASVIGGAKAAPVRQPKRGNRGR
jgi:hypothetical protein